MRQKIFIILGLALLILVLIGLNAVSYTQKEAETESEGRPNRSTYNPGATGTRAFFDLLTETGRKPVRWRDAPAELLTSGKNRPATFVMIGPFRKELAEDEAKAILQWVSEGGKLVLIDRRPPEELLKTSAAWKLSFNSYFPEPSFTTDASDQKAMTAGVKAVRPVQPTVYTKGINGVQPSVFATSVDFAGLTEEEAQKKPLIVKKTPVPMTTFSKATPKPATPPKSFATPTTYSTPKPVGEGAGIGSADQNDPKKTEGDKLVMKTPPPPKAPPKAGNGNGVGIGDGADDSDYDIVSTPSQPAPVVHLTAEKRNLLVDVPYGAGQIVFLTDPYIVANGGINQVDNASLAVNVVASRSGVIAFDEYHHGYGANANRFFQFFAGTPVVPIFIQAVVLLGLLFYSQSRRFARAVPDPEPNRLSKLEYISAMAELQQRTRAYDLAIENIYTDFRRRVARLVGVDALKVRPHNLALLIAERLPDENAAELERLIERCEDVMHGDASGKREVLQLTTRLRELEAKLGLQRRRKSRK
ncbi:MAG: DUF4350 domain-containing protein [Acidobacteria bacterium]|nr:DUF4350 domain-containing protein [Acidobacteriota bacterium]